MVSAGRRRSASVIVTNAPQPSSTSATVSALPSRVSSPITSAMANAETTSAAGARLRCRTMRRVSAASAEPRLKSGVVHEGRAIARGAHGLRDVALVTRLRAQVRVPERGRDRVDDRCLAAARYLEGG